MSILGTLFLRKQTCPNCKQRSNPIAGQGYWQVSGKMGGYSVIKCTKCGAGLVMGFASDSYIMPKDMKRLESERDKIINN